MKSLKEVYGKRYPVEYEESYYAQHGPRARVEDPDLQIIPCRHGHLFRHSDELLAASTNTSGSVATRLKALAGCQVLQDGSDGVTVAFPPELFGSVAKLMRPRRRRWLTDAHRERLVAAGAAGRARIAAGRARQSSGSGMSRPGPTPRPQPAQNPQVPGRFSEAPTSDGGPHGTEALRPARRAPSSIRSSRAKPLKFITQPP